MLRNVCLKLNEFVDKRGHSLVCWDTNSRGKRDEKKKSEKTFATQQIPGKKNKGIIIIKIYLYLFI